MSSLLIACPKCQSRLTLPDGNYVGRKAKCPGCAEKFVIERRHIVADDDSSVVELRLATSTAAPAATLETQPVVRPEQVSLSISSTASSPDPEFNFVSQAATAKAPFRVANLKAAKRRGPGLGSILLGLCLVGVFAAIVYFTLLTPTGTSGSAKKKNNTAAKRAVVNAEADAASDEPATADPDGEAGDASPITLKMAPDGARIILHLRPADLWKHDGPGPELRACLGPLGIWFGSTLFELAGEKPENIDEMLIALIPGLAETFPDVAWVIRTKTDLKRSALLDRYQAALKDDPENPYYVAAKSQRAYLFPDARTIASCPVNIAADMVRSAKEEPIVPENIASILKLTDRRRQLTLIVDPEAIRVDLPAIVPTGVQPLILTLLDWFGDEVEAIAYCMRVTNDKFESHTLVRAKTSVRPSAAKDKLMERLSSLPERMVGVLSPIPPREAGRRQLVGRFPAFLKAFQKQTQAMVSGRVVVLQTKLPSRAAPNILLSGLLTWDHLSKNPSSDSKAAQPAAQPSLPDTVAGRLKTKISVEFRNVPLWQALKDVEEQTSTTIAIAAKDLEAVGVTQNMKQEFKMDDAPATAVLHRILDKIELCIVVDEATKKVTVTSKKAIGERGQTAFPLQ